MQYEIKLAQDFASFLEETAAELVAFELTPEFVKEVWQSLIQKTDDFYVEYINSQIDKDNHETSKT